MKFHRTILPCLLLLASFLQGQEELYDNIYNAKTGTRLTVTAMSSQVPPSGYLPVRVAAINNEKVPVTWRFSFRSRDYYYGNDTNEVGSEFAVSCEPGKRATSEFIVPVVTCFHGASHAAEASVNLSISASPILSGGGGHISTEYEEGKPAVLISKNLYTPNKGTLDSATWPHASGRASVSFGGQFEPRQLTDDWRGYLGFDALMMTSDDWRDTPPGARSAIRKWCRLGGHIIIYSISGEESLANLEIDESGPGESEAIVSWGIAEVLPLPASGVLDATDVISLLSAGSTGSISKLSSLTDDYSGRWPLQEIFGERSFNPILFILILIAFGVLVGPVNLFVFAKSGQRHKLFITTPIISLAASALLIVIILFQDGFGGKGHRLALIEIRPEENVALIQQQQIARTGVLLSTSFEVKNNVHVTPVMLDESRWARVKRTNQGGGGRYRLSPVSANGTELTGDWFKSRSEYGHLLTSIQPTRGRLELASPDGEPVLTSTFDFPIETIYYKDRSGGFWKGSNLQSGKRLALSPRTEADYRKWVKSLTGRLTDTANDHLVTCSEREGHFVAISTSAPQIETLESLNWQESTTILTGPVVEP